MDEFVKVRRRQETASRTCLFTGRTFSFVLKSPTNTRATKCVTTIGDHGGIRTTTQTQGTSKGLFHILHVLMNRHADLFRAKRWHSRITSIVRKVSDWGSSVYGTHGVMNWAGIWQMFRSEETSFPLSTPCWRFIFALARRAWHSLQFGALSAYLNWPRLVAAAIVAI